MTQLRKDAPSEPRVSGDRHRLPDDLLRQSSRRLEIMALIATALWAVGPLLGHLALFAADPADPAWGRFQGIDAISVGVALTSIGVFFYLRRARPDPSRVMDLALAYMLAMAFALGVLIHWGPPSATPSPDMPMITWIGPMILMFAAIVPTEPWKLLLAGFLAASMDSLGMLAGHAAGRYQFGPFQNVLIMHYPNFLLLGVAVVVSRVVTRLGQQVVREREMGSYRLGGLLGRGGMGEVYQATHRMLARPAAIKLIRPEMLAPTDDGGRAQIATTRFRREAEAAAKLRSPHTVELYDFGVTEEGRLYLVMELLEGITLEALVRRYGPQPAARVVHVLRQVCDSLEEAHAAGLVHRDVKPANIHLGRVGRQYDFVKVLDFGLVKSIGGQDESLASAAGITPGTPAYMAPEMAHAGTVDGRADLYSLGCVAYYLLTGQLVFQAETGIQTILMHLQQPPVPPSERAPVPVPPALDRVVLACLAKEPRDRPSSAAELSRALDASGIEPWTEEAGQRWWSTAGV